MLITTGYWLNDPDSIPGSADFLFSTSSIWSLGKKTSGYPLVREGAPQRQDNKFQTQTLEKEAISGQTSRKWARHQDMLTD
jgi:hypothetical protein